MPSAIDAILAAIIFTLLFLGLSASGICLVSLKDKKPDWRFDADEEPYFDEDAYMQATDFSEFYPNSSEDEDQERDWL